MVDKNDTQGIVYPCPDFETFKRLLEQRMLVWQREHFHVARFVKAGMLVFVLQQDTHQLWGIYRASESPELIRSGTENDHFAQVRLL